MSGSLAELFPDGEYRFHLTLRRGEPSAFFAPLDDTGDTLRERGRWLDRDPARYLAELPEAAPLVAEFAALAADWGLVRGDAALATLGRSLETDLLFLSADDGGAIRLRAGALCFPTGWDLREKLGRPMDVIHGAVPGLNAAIGPAIQQVLAKLKPGPAFLRDNWGIAATDELNLHPSRGLPAPAPPVDLNRLWLRIEHQALVALPAGRGIVFGIRIALHRLDHVAGTPAAAGLRRGLATMPAEVAAYKRLENVRAPLLDLL